MRIAYFVHDISDAGVAKRVRMLRAAGAEVVVLGFRREGRRVSTIEGAPALDLGLTHDGRLIARAFKTVQRCLTLGTDLRYLNSADVFLARNLEMLAIAAATMAKHARRVPLVYECLDVHRLMFSGSPAGKLLRLVERMLLRKSKLLILSSPAFITGYFEPKQGLNGSSGTPILIVENKMFDPAAPDAQQGLPLSTELAPGPPWRIGWFGTIRCRRSLQILCELALRNRGLVEIIIRGRPPRVEFGDFALRVEHSPGVTYEGAYDVSELGKLYANVHFAWAIDYFEEGANSSLLLPNRIYEGGRYGAVPIALAGTETGRWLEQRGLGVLLHHPAQELPQLLAGLTPSTYDALKRATRSAPRELFVADERDCQRLMNALSGAASLETACRREAGISLPR